MVETSGTPVLSTRGLTKSYGSFKLGPVDLRVEPGYVVAVVGPNGSGKTTLFRMVMNLARPDEGDLSLFGRLYPSDEVEIKRRVGYVPERAAGHDEMTAEALGSFIGHWYPSWNEALYRELLERFEIEPGKRFGRLSKGMQRRLSFVLAVATDADLLLLDEPTDGVDPFARREMLSEVSRYMDRGERTVLFATHVMEEVRRIADYVAFLVDGEFLGLYEKDALLEEWRALWVERAPESPEAVPGLVSVEESRPVRLVTRSEKETRAALEARGIGVLRSGGLELEEILSHLMDERALEEVR